MPPSSRFFDRVRETMGREERNSHLTQRFVDTFLHAYQHSKAYKEIFDSAGLRISDIKGLNDLERLPVIRIEDLIARQKKDPPFGGFNTIDSDKFRRIYVNPGLIYQPGEQEYGTPPGLRPFVQSGLSREIELSMPLITISGLLPSCWTSR